MKTAIFLGDFEVVDVTEIYIKIHLTQGMVITVHPHNFPHATKVGDKLPLYTELTYAKPQ